MSSSVSFNVLAAISSDSVWFSKQSKFCAPVDSIYYFVKALATLLKDFISAVYMASYGKLFQIGTIESDTISCGFLLDLKCNDIVRNHFNTECTATYFTIGLRPFQLRASILSTRRVELY